MRKSTSKKKYICSKCKVLMDEELLTSIPEKPIKLKKVKSSLSSITNEVMEEISSRYDVPLSFVLSKREDLEDYCESTGKKYKDYISALRVWVKKEALAIRKEEHGKSKIAFIS